MIKQALEYLIGLGEAATLEINGQEYSDKPLHHVAEPVVRKALGINTLSGLAEYVLSEFDSSYFDERLMHVSSHSQVRLLSALRNDGQRETYMIAEAFSPAFCFGQYYDVENFIIALQSGFVRNEDAAKILKLIGNLKDEAVKQYGDDGVTQSVTAKTGIATVEDVVVPNPVTLAPYRTFVEIEQPESDFIFRIKQSNQGPTCALFEADGGNWKLDAMFRIKAYLEEKLAGTEVKVIS